MLFVSDSEVDLEGSKVLKAFSGVNSVQDLLGKKVPLLPESWTIANKKKEEKAKTSLPYKVPCDTDLADLKQNKVIEFDLKYPKALKKSLDVNRLDCYPLVYYELQTSEQCDWTFQL